jgi:hypothetical protein
LLDLGFPGFFERGFDRTGGVQKWMSHWPSLALRLSSSRKSSSRDRNFKNSSGISWRCTNLEWKSNLDLSLRLLRIYYSMNAGILRVILEVYQLICDGEPVFTFHWNLDLSLLSTV